MPVENAYLPSSNLCRSLCQAWEGKLERSRDGNARKRWKEMADECEMFYSGTSGVIWDPANQQRLWNTAGGPVNPTFKFSINRAFELRALIGPTLYWANPYRTATPQELVEPNPMAFGINPQDPMAMQAFAPVQQAHQQEVFQRSMAADLQGRVLNHTPELLNLAEHSEQAITDALIYGRGVLVSELYRHPGSGRLLVGNFYESPYRVYMDPDCHRHTDAWWQARERIEPYWQVEERFRLPRNSLKQAARYESGDAYGERQGYNLAVNASQRATGDANDQIRWFEIFSREGVGIRSTDTPEPYAEELERVVGNYAYLCVAPGVPFLLNCPDGVLSHPDTTQEEIKERLSWPIPFWTEGKFPFNFLDFYGQTQVPWPLPPMAMGLGELKAINVFMCAMASHIWNSSRTLIGVLESARAKVEDVIKNGRDFAVFGIEDLDDDLNKVVQFLTHPPMGNEPFEIVKWLADSFDRRTGLSEILYGMQGMQTSRSATDVKVRQANSSIRPQDMARRVASWQTMSARKEAYGLWFKVEGKDLSDILGQHGAQMWDRYVKGAEGESVVRQIDYRIEAQSMQRPDVERDVQNLQGFMQNFGSFHQEWAGSTGDVRTVNAMQQLFGKAAQMDVRGLMIEPPPKPDPSQDPELQIKQAELQLEQMKAQMQQQIDQAKAQLQLSLDQARYQQGSQQDQQTHLQEMRQDEETHQQEMLQRAREMAAKLDQADAALRQKQVVGRVKIEMARKQAAAKPKATSGAK